MPNGPLTVRANVRDRKGSIESRFERRVADALKKLGLFSYHVAERWYAGIPDRYVVGGNWIEFKVIPCSGTRAVNPIRLFKPAQRNFLDKFAASGDRTWACVMFQPEKGEPHMVLLPWHTLREHGPWTMDEVKSEGVYGGDRIAFEAYIAKRFGKALGFRFSNSEIYDRDRP